MLTFLSYILGIYDTITPKNGERSKGHLRKNSYSNRTTNIFELNSAQNRRQVVRQGAKAKVVQTNQIVQVPARATSRVLQNNDSLFNQDSKDEISLSQVSVLTQFFQIF